MHVAKMTSQKQENSLIFYLLVFSYTEMLLFKMKEAQQKSKLHKETIAKEIIDKYPELRNLA